jgi:hypothetical protein
MGKDVREDYGVNNGRTRDWASIPKGLFRLAPVGGSTTITCGRCGGPYDGLVYDQVSDTFLHRDIMDCRRRNG